MASSIITFDLFIIIIFVVVITSALYLIHDLSNRSNKNGGGRSSPHAHVRVLPPSPPGLPFIGHLHHLLSKSLFKSLHRLSSKHGPLLYLHAFHSPMLLVSSSSVLHDIIRTNDVDFSSRFSCNIDNSIVVGPYGFVTASYGDYWRFMKKIVITELLGQQNLERSRDLRREELGRFFVELVGKARGGEAVDVGREMMKLTNNSICRMAMGLTCLEGGDGEVEKIEGLLNETFGLTKKVLAAIALRRLKRFGISLFEKEVLDVSRRYDELFEKILREHEENPDRERKDMMDVVLEHDISRNHIKAFFVELFIAGTDTSSQATRWAMAELINNPSVLRTLREEIDSVTGNKRLLCETDLPNLPYLLSVIKETLRLHPPGAVMVRKCDNGCKVRGFDIPKDTMLILNFYGMMRDPSVWDNPDVFKPERFLVSSQNGQELDRDRALKYVPFGAGRRACPGANLAYIFMGIAVGTMVQCFDWRIENEKVNMEEAGYMALSMAYPLKSTPVLRFNPLVSTT